MIAYLDCASGVSGDKLLGALLDAGADAGSFTVNMLADAATALAPEARVHVERVSSSGVSALHVEVTGESHAHRTWRDIRTMLEGAELDAAVRDASLEVFGRIADAEGTVHGCAADDVHFHEVGALDSIVDVVGVCLGMHALGIDALTASPLATGWGTVESSHGTLPVPAPATELLLRGVATVPGPSRADGASPGELTTPTGAALVATLARSFGPPPPMVRRAVGYGAGSRDLGFPNVCRVTLGERDAGASPAREAVVLLETNLDHLTPEAVGFAADELLAAEGVLDVWQTPVVMKKQRMAVMLSVLARPDAADAALARVHELTGTLGVRITEHVRSVASRELIEFETPWGPARAKAGAGLVRPEHDDIARIARDAGLGYERVRAELLVLAMAALDAAGDDAPN